MGEILWEVSEPSKQEGLHEGEIVLNVNCGDSYMNTDVITLQRLTHTSDENVNSE